MLKDGNVVAPMMQTGFGATRQNEVELKHSLNSVIISYHQGTIYFVEKIIL